VSRIDDLAAERAAAIENAKRRIAHGKHFPARQLAEKITVLRKMLLEEYGTLDRALDALRDVNNANNGIIRLAQSFGVTLLSVALVSPKALRLVGEAFAKLQHPAVIDPRATAIISAYEQCQLFPPTFGELKHEVIARFGENRWPWDFPVRDTLRFLERPLSKSKRGRPIGARSQLKMFGVPQVRSKVSRPKIRNRKY
jgi:hypothetical protein